jgi:ABC-type nickel/cobalt efflux system permease component RcnA
VGWWGLVVMGMSGGIVPCWDAILILLLAAAADMLWLAVPLLIAFSLGLAGVLVLIGILVVYAKRFADARWEQSRLIKALPIVSAVLIIALGMWICYESIPA